jgi:hypothetical protein
MMGWTTAMIVGFFADRCSMKRCAVTSNMSENAAANDALANWCTPPIDKTPSFGLRKRGAPALVPSFGKKW